MMNEVMDIIPDNAILKGNVLRQAIKEYQDAGFELPNPKTGDEIKAHLNVAKLCSGGSTMLDTVDDILWASIHRNELDELKPKNWKWQLRKDYTYDDFKAGLKSEIAYRNWDDKSKWTPEMYELERNMDDIFNSINAETVELIKQLRKSMKRQLNQGNVIKGNFDKK